MIRGSLAEVISPKPLPPSVRPGASQFGVLKTLKNSLRSCSRAPRVMPFHGPIGAAS